MSTIQKRLIYTILGISVLGVSAVSLALPTSHTAPEKIKCYETPIGGGSLACVGVDSRITPDLRISSGVRKAGIYTFQEANARGGLIGEEGPAEYKYTNPSNDTLTLESSSNRASADLSAPSKWQTSLGLYSCKVRVGECRFLTGSAPTKTMP